MIRKKQNNNGQISKKLERKSNKRHGTKQKRTKTAKDEIKDEKKEKKRKWTNE